MFFKLLTPVINLKRKEFEDNKPKEIHPKRILEKPTITTVITHSSTGSWEEFDFQDEYNPNIPNEYEKIIKDRKEKRNKKEDNRTENRKRHHSPQRKTGFGGRPASDDEDNFRPSAVSSRTGVCVAPPRSLVGESSPVSMDNTRGIVNIKPYGGSAANSVAAKIMAKYGFKDGQGLGKQEQGISMALQVEKTSKRGGRIILEKEATAIVDSPPYLGPPPEAIPFSQEPSITEMMKSTSKIVLLRNMVAPGSVDDDLYSEVKDECNTKYGEVITVHINELKNKSPEESVRIFVEFKRIESAIKAVVDLNGRFFGGRQVRAGFYSTEKYENFIFNE